MPTSSFKEHAIFVVRWWHERKTYQRAMLMGIALSGTVIGVTSVVLADAAHDEAPTITASESSAVAVRTVGDTDPDGIAQEGLGSFYGIVASNDIAPVHASRDGVISSWSTSIGQKVFAGDVLGYVRVVGISAEQQQQLAAQQAAALKAELDFATAKEISSQTRTAFAGIADRSRKIAERQQLFFGAGVGAASSSFISEIAAIDAKKKLFDAKIQDFAASSLTEIYQLIGPGHSNPLSPLFSTLYVDPGIGASDSQLLINYQSYFLAYARKVRERMTSLQDIQEFLSKTNTLLSATLTSTEGITANQLTDIIRDSSALGVEFKELSDVVTQIAIEKAEKDRERYQIEIDLARQMAELENDLARQNLELNKAATEAQNEAAGAKLFAEKLAISAGGIIPILAPRDGIMATIRKTTGSYVTIADEIGLVSDPAPEKIVLFTVPSSWKDMKQGDTLSVSWRPELALIEGVLKGMSPVIDEKGGYQAEISLPRNTIFPLGASVRLVPTASKKGIFVERRAVQFDAEKPFVWIVTEEDTVRKQGILPGRQLGEYVEVRNGLERGFRYLVITGANTTITPGMKLDAVMGTSTKAAPTPPQSGSAVQNESQPHLHDE